MFFKIAFHTPQLDCRGTCVALYDYADYNEKILFNKSLIVVPKSAENEFSAFNKFNNRFKVFFYENIEDLETYLINENYNILYCIKYGKNDNIFSKKIKTVIHCVFDLSEPHGDVYASVSENLAKKYKTDLFVPHMISIMPENNQNNMKNILNIPENGIVFGRHGGMDTFNINFCIEIIKKIVREKNDIYFLFMNTPIFDNHKNIIFLDKNADIEYKKLFISTCDAYIECGTLGHTFGLSIAEFSINNKPIIAYNGNVWNSAHLDILGDKGIYYKNEYEFYNILKDFDPKDYKNKDLNCYKEYSPEKVMQKFEEVFIKSSLHNINERR